MQILFFLPGKCDTIKERAQVRSNSYFRPFSFLSETKEFLTKKRNVYMKLSKTLSNNHLEQEESQSEQDMRYQKRKSHGSYFFPFNYHFFRLF